ncbi:hypothetical protein [Thalassobacillus sp. C254]|uniref:hypothetical protein n=1 Tax=Thalassobacillus sp. C254 TaxID=1225341 RepID=UPI0006D16E26|nr:hypothetical protein [Thalassobacillus sp. C254]
MPKVKKGNRTLKVSDTSVENYLKQGYDQIDEKGKIVKRATGGKTIAAEEYNKLLDKLNTSEEEQFKLEEDNKKLKAEIAKLKK